MSDKEIVVITGAGGLVGTSLRSRLAKPGRVLRLVDIADITDLAEGEEFYKGSFIDMGQMEEACRGASAVVDLARFEIGGEHANENWDLVTEVNIRGIRTMLEAARRQGVKRFVYASSNHVLGFVPMPDGDELVDEYVTPLPDTLYAVGKVLGEGLGSLYHNRFGMDVLCVRIGSQFPEPLDVRMLSTWLSPDDAGRVFEACLTAPDPGFRIVWGISNNTRSRFSRAEGEALGYFPKDDAEDFAEALVAKYGEIDPDDPILQHVGGKSAVIKGR